MAAFFEDITPYYGLWERNADGQTLEEFLESYDPNRFEHPSVTVDTLVFRHPHDMKTVEEGLELLLIRRGNHPGLGKWALPGGFVDMKEDTQDAAARELQEETGLTGLPMEQLRAWGEWKRDPRTRIVTVAYLALIEEGLVAHAGDDAADAGFFAVRFAAEKTERRDARLYTDWRLTLTRADGVEVSALVRVGENEKALLREQSFEQLESNGLAGDHPCIITQALLHLQERIRELG